MASGAARSSFDDGSFYGRGTLAPVLQFASCRGGEASLEGCSFGRPTADDNRANFESFGVACDGGWAGWRVGGWGGNHCTCPRDSCWGGRPQALQHDYQPHRAAPCDTGSQAILGVRLMNGTRPSARAGRVEVHMAGHGWGTITREMDGSATIAAATVCHMLGHRVGTETEYDYYDTSRPGKYGPSPLPLLLTEVRCPDGAATLEQCAMTAAGSNDEAGWGLLEAECTA